MPQQSSGYGYSKIDNSKDNNNNRAWAKDRNEKNRDNDNRGYDKRGYDRDQDKNRSSWKRPRS
jgi:hypothetical protein